MQPWSLSKLLLIIFFLNIDPSVDCLRCSAGNGRQELFELWGMQHLTSQIRYSAVVDVLLDPLTSLTMEVQNSPLWGVAGCSLLTPQSLFAISLRQRELPDTITRWLGRDKRHKNFDPLPNMDTVENDQLSNFRALCGPGWVFEDTYSSIQMTLLPILVYSLPFRSQLVSQPNHTCLVHTLFLSKAISREPGPR